MENVSIWLCHHEFIHMQHPITMLISTTVSIASATAKIFIHVETIYAKPYIFGTNNT